MATRWNLRGTTLFKAFLLNSLVAALIATVIVEIRLALNAKQKAVTALKLYKALVTFAIGFVVTFVVYNIMYVVLSYGSSLIAAKHSIPYW